MEPPKTEQCRSLVVDYEMSSCAYPCVCVCVNVCVCVGARQWKEKYKSNPCVKQETRLPTLLESTLLLIRRDGSSRRLLKDFITRVCWSVIHMNKQGGGGRGSGNDMNIIKRNPHSIPCCHQAGPNITLPAPSHRTWQTHRRGNTLKGEPEWDRSADIQRSLSVTTFVVYPTRSPCSPFNLDSG